MPRGTSLVRFSWLPRSNDCAASMAGSRQGAKSRPTPRRSGGQSPFLRHAYFLGMSCRLARQISHCRAPATQALSFSAQAEAAMTDSDAVLAANLEFYRAFATRDLDAMDALWARQAPVACIHPGWPPLADRPSIMASWRGILSNSDSPRIVWYDERA